MIDLVEMKYLTFDEENQGTTVTAGEIPEGWAEEAAEARERMLDRLTHLVSGEDADRLTEILLEDEVPEPSLIRAVIRQGTLGLKFTPVFCGASFRNKGVQPLLDAVGGYLPSPPERGQITGIHPKTAQAVSRQLTDKEHLAALAFKTIVDAHGELTFVRVYSGRLEVGDALLSVRTAKKERVSRIFLMHADKREAVESLSSGEIGAVLGLRFTVTGDTLADPDHPVLLEKMTFPDTVISLGIEPKSSADKDRLAAALEKVAREDPTFRFFTHRETGQLLISGMGELHLEVIRNRVAEEFKVPVNTGQPMVAYKETLKKAVTVKETFERHSL